MLYSYENVIICIPACLLSLTRVPVTNSTIIPRFPIAIVSDDICYFLAPPAGRQWSFSNADSSVVRRRLRRRRRPSSVVNFSLKILFSQKRPDNWIKYEFG